MPLPRVQGRQVVPIHRDEGNPENGLMCCGFLAGMVIFFVCAVADLHVTIQENADYLNRLKTSAKDTKAFDKPSDLTDLGMLGSFVVLSALCLTAYIAYRRCFQGHSPLPQGARVNTRIQILDHSSGD